MPSTKNRKHKNKIKNGGKVLGEGNYGCIVHPSYPCKSRKKNKVSKLSNPDRTAPIPKVYRKISKIPNYHNYFIFPNEICSINPDSISSDDKKGCKMVKFNKTVINSIMQKGDHDLANTGKISTSTAVSYLKKLLKCISILAKHRIAHFDIKALNILIHNKQAYLIDFDDYFNPTDWYEFDDFLKGFSYMKDTYVWPPEIYFLFNHFAPKMPPIIEDYLHFMFDEKTSSFKKFIEKIMIYELGLAFLEITDDIKKSKSKDNFLHFLKFHMLDQNPYTRITITQAQFYLNKNF